MATIEKQLEAAKEKIEALTTNIAEQKDTIKGIEKGYKDLEKELGSEVTNNAKLNTSITGQKETIAQLREEVKSTKKEASKPNSEEAQYLTEVLKEQMDNNPTDFSYDPKIEVIQLKNRNDKLVGKHITTIYKNDKDLEGSDLRDALEANKLDILHVFLDLGENEICYLPAQPQIDKAVLKNRLTKKIMRIVCLGKNDNKDLDFTITEA